MNERIEELERMVIDLTAIVEAQQRHIVNIVRALRAHSEDLQINLGTTTGSLK